MLLLEFLWLKPRRPHLVVDRVSSVIVIGKYELFSLENEGVAAQLYPCCLGSALAVTDCDQAIMVVLQRRELLCIMPAAFLGPQ